MLSRMPRTSVSAKPAKTAIVQGEQRVSYEELDHAVGQYTGFLRQAGVGPGDCVAVALPNCAEFIITFFAIARLPATMLPLNRQDTPDELRRSPADCPAKILITDAAREVLYRDMASRLIVVDREQWSRYAELPCPENQFSGDAVESTGISADDNILCTIPLYHSYSLESSLLEPAHSGATLVLVPDSDAPFAASHQNALKAFRAENIRVLPGVPYRFLSHCRCRDG
jgi:long-chain acyl-CoA synthetase